MYFIILNGFWRETKLYGETNKKGKNQRSYLLNGRKLRKNNIQTNSQKKKKKNNYMKIELHYLLSGILVILKWI